MTILRAASQEEDDDDDSSSPAKTNATKHSEHSLQEPDIESSSSDDLDEIKNSPLGYQYFLYDVNVEYNPGGNLNDLLTNKQSFKMKCLPYMVERDIRGANSYLSDCSSDNSVEEQFIDVTKESCAFLSNSEYVPNLRAARRRVVIELISAKLSQTKTYNLVVNGSYANKVDNLPYGSVISTNSDDNTSLSDNPSDRHLNHSRTSDASQSSSPPVSSRRFVNYTILIKTAPGLDTRPAVIERRFSDFLQLYQGLKSSPSLAKLVDGCVSFPKKVLVGNFSLINIAERSIEFSRLLSLCILRKELLWSTSFVAFLLDKEIKEAQQLALYGDPDDCQALIESAYFIEQKLYINRIEKTDSVCSSSDGSPGSQDSFTGRYSPILQNGRPVLVQSPSSETISGESNTSNANNRTPRSERANPSPDQSVCDTNENNHSNRIVQEKVINTSINQRILVTFCILFIVYCRGSCFKELKRVVEEFSQLISSQNYVDSLINTRQYNTLRACLLFLMNLNNEDVIDESRRILLKRVLEDVDGLEATVTAAQISPQTTGGAIRRLSRASSNSRITKDLASLIRDKNFCSFQEDKNVKC